MKINIITIQYAHNYGAVLQAYSLKNVLLKMGHEVEIINYIPEKEKNKYTKKLKNEVGLKYAIRHFKINLWISGFITAIFAQKDWNIRYDNFENFIKQNLISNYMDNKKLSLEEIEKINTDCFICGSDQIWNNKITGKCNPIYYLGFNTSARKISYAASMGNVRKPSDDEKSIIGNWLKEFKAISVREEPFAEMLKEEYNLENVQVVLDPCLLLKAEDFKELINNKKLEEKQYILNYFISESGLLKKLFKKINKFLDKDIIEIHWKKQLFQKNKNQRNSLSVNDFLWYIYNSNVLYTDSFHGVVFSLLFHKNFYAVYEENARIDSLLEKVGLKDRHITILNDKEEDITKEQWEIVDKKLEELRNESINYLKTSLL